MHRKRAETRWDKANYAKLWIWILKQRFLIRRLEILKKRLRGDTEQTSEGLILRGCYPVLRRCINWSIREVTVWNWLDNRQTPSTEWICICMHKHPWHLPRWVGQSVSWSITVTQKHVQTVAGIRERDIYFALNCSELFNTWGSLKCNWVLWGTSGYFDVPLGTLRYFWVLLSTLRYFLVFLGTSGYF